MRQENPRIHNDKTHFLSSAIEKRRSTLDEEKNLLIFQPLAGVRLPDSDDVHPVPVVAKLGR